MNNPKKISEVSIPIEDVEQKSDLELKDELTKLIGSKEAVLIVGAGSSKRLDYPDWQDLLMNLENLATKCNDGFKPNEKKREYNPLEYVEDIKSYITRESGDLSQYYALLDRSFEPKKYLDNGLEFHKTLVALPFRGILTTNYDVVLEDALEEIGKRSIHKNSFVVNKNNAGQVHRFLLSIIDIDILGVAHLHGKYDDVTNIILSSKDYERVYGPPVIQETSKLNLFQRFCFWILRRKENQVLQSSEWTLHRKLLWAVLATRRVVFVGFSMKDPYFNKMLKSVSNDLWRWDRPIHFAITSISSERSEASQARLKAERFKRNYGIETLFYVDTDGKHQGLADIVYEIAQKLDISFPSDTIHPDLPSETGDGLDKVKQMSELMVRKISNGN